MFIVYNFFTLFLFIVRYGRNERLMHDKHSGVLVIFGFHKVSWGTKRELYDTLKNKS